MNKSQHQTTETGELLQLCAVSHVQCKPLWCWFDQITTQSWLRVWLNVLHYFMMLLMCLCVSLTFLVNVKDFFTSDTQVLKKDQPQSEPRHFWDVLRQGARIVLFSDLTEVQISSMFISFLIPIIHSTTPSLSTACEVQLIVVCLIFVELPYFIHYCFTTCHVVTMRCKYEIWRI